MKLIMENWRQYLEEDVGGFTAEYQLFIPRKCPDLKCEPSKLSSAPPVENRSDLNKPIGGFWTSTANKSEIWTSDWNEWMKYNMPQWMHPKGILLRPKTDNVFHIENNHDAKLLHEEFPLEFEGPSFSFSAFSGPSVHNIDFEAALKKHDGYDGIHWGMKDGGHSHSSFGRSGMWDVESTVWRDASVLEVVEIVEVAQREASDDIY